jgi:hypothetical protein
MKNIFFGLIVLFSLQGCWAPRCPLVGCRVGRVEHRHQELTGTFAGKSLIPPKFHYFWDKQKPKGESLKGSSVGPDGKKRKRFKRLMPWEKN